MTTTPPDSNGYLNELYGQSAADQADLSDILLKIKELTASMEPDSIAEITELIELKYRTVNRWRLLQSVLSLARVLQTQLWDAPKQPSGDGKILAKREGIFDIYNQEDNNKIVTVYVGRENKQVKFTATAAILSAQASFFKPLCGDRWNCGRESTITLSEHSPESFEIFLSWLYTKDIKNASCLIKIHPTQKEMSNLYFRKESHKSRWFQLLHCYFLADYICAPKFANYIIDALVFAYKEWSESEFGKIVRQPLFDDVEKTWELVDMNTSENSPLRSLIKDILMPRMELWKALTVDERSSSSRMPFRIRRGRVHLSDELKPERLPQNVQFYNNGTAINSGSQPGHSVTAQPVLNHLPFDPSQLHHQTPIQPQTQPQVTHPTFWQPPNPHPHPHPHHHNHNHNSFPTHAPQPLQPLQPSQPPHPRPHRLSRFLMGITRRTGNDNININYDPQKIRTEFHKAEKAVKVWEEGRYRYHVHVQGRDCGDDHEV
ncbi:1710e88f-3b99-4f61-9ecb-19d189c59a96 [Sclerotinia trifoliorum]|uniref:1710e88f-3b99-4f61-9ecb-19d189c59a96 n=1 Tax=Sclerotinia trifoliorum TaxID=28548 RepID=A0A8H2VPY8_9HELO|nr:1710e88f-3b99-4f61-9ecb-19d189c59a96 [Sclerotinia trifoliorum]